MQREEGFYWVKFCGENEWTVAQFTSSYLGIKIKRASWIILGEDIFTDDDNFDIIGERILPPQ